MIELREVTKSYGARLVLEATSLTLTPGQTTVLIGPSGCGKSTLLRLMIGLIRPDSGALTFDGAPLTEAALPGLRQRMGYVIQSGGLFPHLRARENVTLMAEELGWTREAMTARVEELRELVRLEADALERFPGRLSGGQRQRVSLMRALMLDPEVLLLDEPLGALDPMIRAEVQDDLASIFARLSKTVVLVTHDLAEAAFFGHHIVLLEAGRIAQAGPFAELVEAPASDFVTRFVHAQRRAHAGLEATKGER